MTTDSVRFAKVWLAAEEEAGRQHGPLLLATGIGLWRSEMNRDPNLRRYGTLRYLLDAIYNDVLSQPDRARERACVVIEYVDDIAVPNDHYHAFLGGYAWKVYANTLLYAGAFPDALEAARKSQSIFGRVGSLACEAAKASLVEALVLREFGDLDAVLRIAKAAAAVFRDHADAEAYMNARMTESLALSDARRHQEAMTVLKEVGEDAERRGDRRTLAICLHNTAELSRALGDRVTAKDLNARALAIFDELGSTIEKPSIRWTEALALADEGRVGEALLELYRTRSEFLALGMNGSATDVGLEIVRQKFHRGDDVTGECVELIETMSRAGMIQPAIEALSYLREQSRRKTISEPKIQHVREFIREAVAGPPRLFLPPPGGED